MRSWLASLYSPGILLLLLATGTSALPPDDLPPELLLLTHFKQKVRQEIGHLTNCTCIETIERSIREPGTGSFRFLDRVRLEISTASEKELLTWPGGERFEDWAVTSFVKSGLVASGMFSSFARNLFLNDSAAFHYVGPEELEGRRAVRYDFTVSRLSSSYRLRLSGESVQVALKGSFWFDAGSLQLLRLDEIADEIPAGMGLSGSLTRIWYAYLPNTTSEILVPRTAEIVLTHDSGEARRNKIEFAQCREYRAESSISFGASAAAADASKKAPSSVDLPPGLKIKMDLVDGIDSATAAIGDVVRGRVSEDVNRGGKKIVPKGAIATGRIRGTDRQTGAVGVVVGIELSAIEWDDSRADLHADLLTVRSTNSVQKTSSQDGGGNIVPLAGGSPSLEIRESVGNERRVASRIPGVGMIFVQGETWRCKPGLELVWRTFNP